MHWAARYSDETMFNYLLTQGMDKNLHIKNAQGQSLFLIAAKFHNLEIMKLLLNSDYEMDINQHDEQNNNAMTLALVDNKLTGRASELAAFLINNGFVFGDDQLLSKVIDKQYLDMAVLLLNAGADVNAVNGNDFPLKQAVYNDDAEAVAFLLEAGAKTELLAQHDLPLDKIEKYYPNAAEVIKTQIKARMTRTLMY